MVGGGGGGVSGRAHVPVFVVSRSPLSLSLFTLLSSLPVYV